MITGIRGDRNACCIVVIYTLAGRRNVAIAAQYIGGDGIAVDVVLRRYDEITGDIGEVHIPAGESVTGASRVGGCVGVAAVVHRLGVQRAVVPSFERYRGL